MPTNHIVASGRKTVPGRQTAHVRVPAAMTTPAPTPSLWITRCVSHADCKGERPSRPTQNCSSSRRPAYEALRTGSMTSLRRRNGGVHGGSKRAERGWPAGSSPAVPMSASSRARRLSYFAADAKPE